MRSIKIAGLTIVAVLALSAMTASAAAAEEFIASKAGKLTGKALNTQEFKTGGAVTVKCTTAAPSGEVEAGKLKTLELKVSATFSACSNIIGTVTVSLADLTLFLPHAVSLLNLVMIHFEVLGVKCMISIPAGQTLGKAAGEIEYVNRAGKIEEKNKVKGIASEVTESNSTSLCGTVGEKLTGEYAGNDELELEGGTIEVK